MNCNNITILCPYNKEINKLNKKCQEIYHGNIGSDYLDYKYGIKWIVGDRVMMTENMSKANVFNGDEGIITKINHLEESVTVEFDRNTLKFSKDNDDILDKDDIDENTLPLKYLTHSYAMTINKSQGSEWKYVILYIPYPARLSFCNFKLIYTGITRAKEIVRLIGYHSILNKIANTKPPKYHDNLSQRLIDYL